MTANELRTRAFLRVGIPGGTIQDFQSLSAGDKKRINDATAEIILEKPGEFSSDQVRLAELRFNRPGFGEPLPEIEELTFAQAFQDEAKKVVSNVAETASAVVEGGLRGLLAANPIVFFLGVAAIGFVVYRLLK